jgi:hypothetical protein
MFFVGFFVSRSGKTGTGAARYFSKKGKTQRSGGLNRAMLWRSLVGLFSAAAQLSVLAETEPTRSGAR